MAASSNCVFCRIVAKEEPATIHFEDDQVIAISNVLNWVPVMLLVMPKEHMTQIQLWEKGPMEKVGQVVVEVGAKFCPNGFRVLSNFGPDAMQSQQHGHVHVIGGVYLGPYA